MRAPIREAERKTGGEGEGLVLVFPTPPKIQGRNFGYGCPCWDQRKIDLLTESRVGRAAQMQRKRGHHEFTVAYIDLGWDLPPRDHMRRKLHVQFEACQTEAADKP